MRKGCTPLIPRILKTLQASFVKASLKVQEPQATTAGSHAPQANLVGVVDTTSPPCSRYSFMHDKRVITQEYSTYGSYNLSCAARFANREAIALLATDETEIDDFDGLWNQLEHRKLDAVYSNFYPPEFRVPKHPRTT